MIGYSRWLTDEQPLTVLPSIAKKIGLNRAVFLQQLHYWIKKDKVGEYHDGHKWVYNSYKDWTSQFPFWSEEAIRKVVRRLRDVGIIVCTEDYNKRKGDHTLWYRIDYDRLNQIMEYDGGGPDKSNGGGPDKSTDQGPDKSWERYQRLPETTSRRDAKASQNGDKPWFTTLCDRFNEVGLVVSDEDRKRLPGNLLRLQKKHGANEQEMYQVINHLVARRRAGYVLSPQDALNDVRGVSRGSKGIKTTRNQGTDTEVPYSVWID